MVCLAVLERNAHRILAIATIARIEPVPRNFDVVVELPSLVAASIHNRSFNSASAAECKRVKCNLSSGDVFGKYGFPSGQCQPHQAVEAELANTP